MAEGVDLADERPERPLRGDAVAQVNPHAYGGYHQVRQRLVQQQNVGGRPHPLVEANDEDDHGVARGGQQEGQHVEDDLQGLLPARDLWGLRRGLEMLEDAEVRRVLGCHGSHQAASGVGRIRGPRRREGQVQGREGAQGRG